MIAAAMGFGIMDPKTLHIGGALGWAAVALAIVFLGLSVWLGYFKCPKCGIDIGFALRRKVSIPHNCPNCGLSLDTLVP